jgi:hypothetical protein
MVAIASGDDKRKSRRGNRDGFSNRSCKKMRVKKRIEKCIVSRGNPSLAGLAATYSSKS